MIFSPIDKHAKTKENNILLYLYFINWKRKI